MLNRVLIGISTLMSLRNERAWEGGQNDWVEKSGRGAGQHTAG